MGNPPTQLALTRPRSLRSRGEPSSSVACAGKAQAGSPWYSVGRAFVIVKGNGKFRVVDQEFLGCLTGFIVDS